MDRRVVLAFSLVIGIIIAISGLVFLYPSFFNLSSLNNEKGHDRFITIKNGQFILDGTPYYFCGTNFWQGMNLGVEGSLGNKSRLNAELNHLAMLGVTNLRIMAASEGPTIQPYRMKPVLMESPGIYNEEVFKGLDYFLYQIKAHNMTAVMVLNNFWYWSGGMAQYVSWYENSSIPYPEIKGWDAFMNYSAKFYQYTQCQIWYKDHIRTLISRNNTYTGIQYRNEPTILAWELANEPRRYPISWISETADYIKSLDPHHLVTTGSEGTPPWEDQNFTQTHKVDNIDYCTIHIWPQNWGWFDPENAESTFNSSQEQAVEYFETHVNKAIQLGKPLVLEEFGLARDWDPFHNVYNVSASTNYRDKFFQTLFDKVYDFACLEYPVAGDNFWVWSGQARLGDTWIGDPPHEIPGWYSVYDVDTTTLNIINQHADDMNAL